MSYLALAVSSNAVLSACSKRPEPPPASYRDSEPRILEGSAGSADLNADPTAQTATSAAAIPIATTLAALRSPGEDHFGYCAAGLTRSGDTRLDLTRLGALCGPGNGLLVYEPPFQATASASGGLRRELELRPDQCLRIAVVTDNPAQALRVVMAQADGAQPETCRVGFGWCPPSGVWCTPSGSASVEFSGQGADVQFQARLWTLRPLGRGAPQLATELFASPAGP